MGSGDRRASRSHGRTIYLHSGSLSELWAPCYKAASLCSEAAHALARKPHKSVIQLERRPLPLWSERSQRRQPHTMAAGPSHSPSGPWPYDERVCVCVCAEWKRGGTVDKKAAKGANKLDIPLGSGACRTAWHSERCSTRRPYTSERKPHTQKTPHHETDGEPRLSAFTFPQEKPS